MLQDYNSRVKRESSRLLSGHYEIEWREEVDFLRDVFRYCIDNHNPCKSTCRNIMDIFQDYFIRDHLRDDLLLKSFLSYFVNTYNGPNVFLYRGEEDFLISRNEIGFSWTNDIGVAKLFARGRNRMESDGVVLRCEFSCEDVYFCRKCNKADTDYSMLKEPMEYVVNPPDKSRVVKLKNYPYKS